MDCSTVARTAVFALSLFAFGCAGEDRAPQAAAGTEGVAGPSTLPTGQNPACEEAEERSCRKIYGQQNGVVDCFEGVEVCENGAWSDCLDATTAARNMSCPVSSLDVPSVDWVPSAKMSPSFAKAWRDATSTFAGGVLLVRLTDLDTEAKVAVGPSNGRVPAAFGPVAAPTRFPLRISKTRGFHLEERETSMELRVQSFGEALSIPIAFVKVDGRFATGCRGVESLTIALFIPEAAGTLRLGEESLAAHLGAPESRDGVRGWSIVLESSRQGS